MPRHASREIVSDLTGTSFIVGTAIATGADPSAGRFVTICGEHHTVLNSRTWQLAIDAIYHPDWCEQCQPALAR